MTANLPDINVLIALAWSNHIQHSAAREWFAAHRQESFATCPITEAGFVRLSMNASVVGESISFRDAMAALNAYRGLPHHTHWQADIDFFTAAGKFQITGYRQTTDAYLLGLAVHHGGKLVTFDTGITELTAGNAAIEKHLYLVRWR